MKLRFGLMIVSAIAHSYIVYNVEDFAITISASVLAFIAVGSLIWIGED